MRLQFWHIVVIVLLIVILFGAKRLPDVASSVGKSLKIFKKEVSELREDDSAAPGDHTTGPRTTPGTTPPATTRGDDPGTTHSPGGTGTDHR